MVSDAGSFAPVPPDLIARAPKVLLHDHLDGGLRPETIIELARTDGYEGLPTTDPDELRAWFVEAASSGSLERYLETFAHTVGVTQTADGLRRVAREARRGPRRRPRGLRGGALRARAAHREGPRPSTRSSRRCWPGSPRASGSRPPRADRIRIGVLLTAIRTATHSRRIAELAVEYRDRGVVGFDIAGAEAGFPPTRHLDAFEYLRRENAHFTIHAGEAFGLPSIWEAIQWCGADRLGHGVRIVDDIEIAPDGEPHPRPARGVRPRPPHPAGDVPVVERPDGRGREHRAAPDRAAAPARLPGHGQHRQPADVGHVDDPRDGAAQRRLRVRARTTSSGSPSTR